MPAIRIFILGCHSLEAMRVEHTRNWKIWSKQNYSAPLIYSFVSSSQKRTPLKEWIADCSGLKRQVASSHTQGQPFLDDTAHRYENLHGILINYLQRFSAPAYTRSRTFDGRLNWNRLSNVHFYDIIRVLDGVTAKLVHH